ncbi:MULTISPECIES: hypothetical protein [Acinetobacter]|uniref:Uncharacterized protein n=1 Tax=Acinetobacter pittii TaxID=48296 RepID=A0A242U610_ACIPI|nr:MULTISPECIES: hypothetical protein [Acinetobacter]OTU28501.1 hypothetical protein CAT59_08085 [Acinetobacter pittii]
MKEIALIPKGAKVQIMGCTYTLIEEANVEGYQSQLNDILKAQKDFDEEIRICGSRFMNSANQPHL